MVRVLQLVDRGAGFQAERGASVLARDMGSGFAVRVQTMSAGGGCAGIATALPPLRRAAGPDTIVHAWGGRALAAAVLNGQGPILYSPSDAPRAESVRWVRAVMAYRDVHVICPSAGVQRMHVERGVPIERCHLVRPGVEFNRIRRRRDDTLRASLGFDTNDRVLLLGGESTRANNHRFGAWAGAILGVLDPKYRLLIWGRGDDVATVADYSRTQRQPKLVTVAEARLGRSVDFEELLPAADIILATAERPVATLPVAIGMAAALPIVGVASPILSELLEDRHTALLSKPGSAKLLARRVLDLEEDSGLQWSISDMARTEAYEYFALTRFVNQHREIYRMVAERRPVELPPLTAGAGLRFHGRA